MQPLNHLLRWEIISKYILIALASAVFIEIFFYIVYIFNLNFTIGLLLNMVDITAHVPFPQHITEKDWKEYYNEHWYERLNNGKPKMFMF